METDQGRQREQPVRRTGEKPQNCGPHPGARQQVRCEESAPTNRARDQAMREREKKTHKYY